MQYRKGVRNSGAVNENLHQSYNPEKPSTDQTSVSSDEYEEETHIRYHFRRWANHIWSVSTNVTSKLRDLLNSHSSSNTTSNHSVEESCQDESTTTSWTTSSGFIESSNRIDGRECNASYHQNTSDHRRSTPRENYYCGYDQKFSHVTGDRRVDRLTANGVETRPNFVMGHGTDVATYPPVLILPRLHQGVNRQVVDARSHQSRKHMSRGHNMHGDESADAWYQHYNHSGRRWDCVESRGEDHQRIPEKLDSLTNDLKTEGLTKKLTRTSRRDRKAEPCDHDLKSAKHFSDDFSDFRAESYRSAREPIPPIRITRPLREKTLSKSRTWKNYENIETHRKVNYTSESTAHTKTKKVIWDLQLSDVMSQDSSSANLSRLALSAKSSITLNIQKRSAIVDWNRKPAANIDIPVKDDAKHGEIIVPRSDDNNAIEQPQIVHDIQTAKKNSEKKDDDLVNGKGRIKWSSVTENSVDSLLQSLRERMATLSNIHSPDTGITSGSTKYSNSLTKECFMASCLAGTCLPQCVERQNEMAIHSVPKNEEMRQSFCDRIQDIWQDGRCRLRTESSRQQALSSRYDSKAEKDLPSKYSLLGLNQEPVLREYFSEYNNAGTLVRILEKLIDSKSKNDITPSSMSEPPKPPPRFSSKEPQTCLRVDVGVQNSTPMSTSFSQDLASYSKHRLPEKRRSRSNSGKNSKPEASQLPIEAPRRLQVFSGRSIIPISSIQFTPVIQPLSNLSGYRQSPLDTKSSANCYSDPSDSHEHSIIINDPVFQKENSVPVINTGLEWSSFFSNHDSPSFIEGSYSRAKVEPPNEVEMNRQVVDEHEHVLSLVLEKIEHRHQYVQRLPQNTDVSQQHSLHHSTPVAYQESAVVQDRTDTAPQGKPIKSSSWWKKKFRSDRNSNFKGKMACLFKYATKKHIINATDSHFQNDTPDKAGNVVPIPPVRMRRNRNTEGTKSSKSIQWELPEDVPPSIKKIDSFQVTENQQSNKSTSVGLIIKKATVTSGTNTIFEESRETSTSLFLINKNETLVSPEIIGAPTQACIDFSNELSASQGKSVDSNIVRDEKEKSESLATIDEPACDHFSLPPQGNVEPLIDPCREEKSGASTSKKFKFSRSLSSKIPLATKPVNHLNAASIISGERPSTAPVLDNLSNHSLRLNEFFGDLEVGKAFGRACTNHEAVKKALFKHNRSSLLRANNSMTNKCTMDHVNFHRNTAGQRNMERTSILRAPTSPPRIGERNAPVKISWLGDTPSENPNSGKPSAGTENDPTTKTVMENAMLSETLEIHSTSSGSEQPIKQAVNEHIPSCDLGRVSLLKMEDSMHNEEIIDAPLAPSEQLASDSKQSNDEFGSLPEDSKSNCKDSENSDDERPPPKASEFPVNVESCSLNTKQEEEGEASINREAKEFGADENIIYGSTHLKEDNGCDETFSTFCNSASNEKSQKDDELTMKSEINKDLNLKSLRLNGSEGIDSKKSCLSSSDVSRQQFDEKNLFTGSSVVKEQPDRFLACRVKIAGLQAPWDKESKFQPQFAYATTGDMEKKHSFKHPLPLRNNAIHRPEKMKKTRLQHKAIPSSRIPHQYNTGKNSVRSARLLCKHATPSVMTSSNSETKNDNSKTNPFENSNVLDDLRDATVKSPERQNQDSQFESVHKPANTIPRVNKSMKNSKQKITMIRETRDTKPHEILDAVPEVIELVINESVNVNRKTNLEMVHPRQRIPSNFKEFPKLSIIESVEPIRDPNILGAPQSIGQNICPAATDAVDERYSSLSCSLNQKKEFGSSCSQKDSNIWLRTAELYPNPTNEPEVISDVTYTDEKNNDDQRIRSSEKFLMAINQFPKDRTSEISTLLSMKSAKNPRDEGKFAAQRPKIPCGLSEKTIHHDNELEVTVMPPKIGTNKNREEVIPFEIEYYSTQSSNTYDVVEIVGKPEIFCPSIFDVHLERNVEFAKSKAHGTGGKKKFENRKLLGTDGNPRMMDNENSGTRRSTRSRNVKIDNGVLEGKVKSSIQNVVPLKEMTITEPSIIRYNHLNDYGPMTDRVRRKEDLPKNLCNNSQDAFSQDAVCESEKQCSHTTRSDQENHDINIGSNHVSEIPSKLKNARFHTDENLAPIIAGGGGAVVQDNLVLNTTRLKLNDEPAIRRRGTLIPRYKKSLGTHRCEASV